MMERRGGPASEGAASGARPEASGVDPDGIDTHRPRDVLERLLSEVDEFRLDPPAHVLVRRARNGHATRFGDALQPRGDVDAVANDILAFNQHIAEMDADPVEDALRLRGGFVGGRHLRLHRQRAFDRRDDGREFDEYPVARGLEQAPAVRGDNRLSGLPSLTHEARRAGLVLAHHARVADDVGGENRGKLARGCHRSTSTLRGFRLIITTTGPEFAPYLIGGAYCRPPLFHSAFKPRAILIGEPWPTLRSKISP